MSTQIEKIHQIIRASETGTPAAVFSKGFEPLGYKDIGVALLSVLGPDKHFPQGIFAIVAMPVDEYRKSIPAQEALVNFANRRLQEKNPLVLNGFFNATNDVVTLPMVGEVVLTNRRTSFPLVPIGPIPPYMVGQ